jgi:hypothetical protein
MRWWSWLARPPIAAGFATVMAATVVGLMWWDRPLDEAVPQRAAPALATRPAAQPSRNEAAKAIVPAENAAQPARAPERVAKRETAPHADATSAPSPAAADTSAAAAPAPLLVPAPAAAQALRRRSAEAAAPLAGALAADAPERWTWQRVTGPQPMTPALQRWLAQLDRAARWAPATSAPPDDAERLRLARDGAPNATIALGTDAVWLLRDGAPPLAAPLAPEAAAALRSALDAATR